MKSLLILISLFSTINVFSQSNIQIEGQLVNDKSIRDSIFFINGEINSKYYQSPIIASEISNNTFNLNTSVSYPQMYRYVLKSDKNKLLYRSGVIFIDSMTNLVNLDYNNEECIVQNGLTATEYYKKFIPFIGIKEYECSSEAIYNLTSKNNAVFDNFLLPYVKLYPDSYVALWFLTERFNMFGYSELRQDILMAFSAKMKKTKLWISLSDDIRSFPIKLNTIFPEMYLSDTTLSEHKLVLPPKKLILIEFWWSHCAPCLASFPKLNFIYDEFKDLGFEIIGISIDREKDIMLWKQNISKYKLRWPQYLDKDAKQSKKLSIKYFPTNILTDGAGKILYKDIKINDLISLLEKKCSPKSK